MLTPLSRRVCAILFLGLALSACEPVPGDDPIDVTELVRVAPDDLRVRSFVPPGLSSTGDAFLLWVILGPDRMPQSEEFYELVERGSSDAGDGAAVQIVYALDSSDYRRFQGQQVLQRAQLLSGYYGLGLLAGPILCDRAGIPVGGRWVYSVLSNAGNDAKITTIRVPGSAAEIKAGAEFCT